MAFNYTKSTQEGHAFGLKVVAGTYTSTASDTGGVIYTGLSTVVAMHVNGTSSTHPYITDVPDGGVLKATDGITIVTAANGVGSWIACGL